MLLIAAPAFARQEEISDAPYMKQALSAAPPAVARQATVVRMGTNGQMRTRNRTDGFTCMILGGHRMPNDANAIEFFSAVMNHTAPLEGLGISYMLAGHHGASSADSHATGKKADNIGSLPDRT